MLGKKLSFGTIVAPLAKIREKLIALKAQNDAAVTSNTEKIASLNAENVTLNAETAQAVATVENIDGLFKPKA